MEKSSRYIDLWQRCHRIPSRAQGFFPAPRPPGRLSHQDPIFHPTFARGIDENSPEGPFPRDQDVHEARPESSIWSARAHDCLLAGENTASLLANTEHVLN